MNALMLSPDQYQALRKKHCQKRSSKWGGPSKVVPRLLPLQIGDGASPVVLSFYSKPDMEIVVLFDSGLPLDLPDSERFKQYEGRRSFRDYLDLIYDSIPENFRVSATAIRDGSAWCDA